MTNKREQIYERNVRHAHLFLRRHFGSRTTVIPSPRGPDVSFSRWRLYYKSRGSFPVYLASEVQKQSNAPVPGQKLATKVSKSRAIPPYVPGVNPPGWPLISALLIINRGWRSEKTLQILLCSSNVLLKHWTYFPKDMLINSKTRYLLHFFLRINFSFWQIFRECFATCFWKLSSSR